MPSRRWSSAGGVLSAVGDPRARDPRLRDLPRRCRGRHRAELPVSRRPVRRLHRTAAAAVEGRRPPQRPARGHGGDRGAARGGGDPRARALFRAGAAAAGAPQQPHSRGAHPAAARVALAAGLRLPCDQAPVQAFLARAYRAVLRLQRQQIDRRGLADPARSKPEPLSTYSAIGPRIGTPSGLIERLSARTMSSMVQLADARSSGGVMLGAG